MTRTYQSYLQISPNDLLSHMCSKENEHENEIPEALKNLATELQRFDPNKCIGEVLNQMRGRKYKRRKTSEPKTIQHSKQPIDVDSEVPNVDHHYTAKADIQSRKRRINSSTGQVLNLSHKKSPNIDKMCEKGWLEEKNCDDWVSSPRIVPVDSDVQLKYIEDLRNQFAKCAPEEKNLIITKIENLTKKEMKISKNRETSIKMEQRKWKNRECSYNRNSISPSNYYSSFCTNYHLSF